MVFRYFWNQDIKVKLPGKIHVSNFFASDLDLGR